MGNIEEIQEVPTVFISYSWSSQEHKKWVLELAERLVEKSGLNVILDVWHLKPGHDRFHFMEESVKDANKVLVICDNQYIEKANSRGGGVGTETQIITPDIYGDTKQEKFIPIAMNENRGELLLPNYFKSRFAINMTNQKNFEQAYSHLEMLIWGVQPVNPPKRGAVPSYVGNGVNSTNTSVEEKIIDNQDLERVLWLLPRGFLLMENITYQKSDSWGAVVNYFDQEGEWVHGTHYHDSYSRSWDRDIKVQFRKLGIPQADWLWASAPLNFFRELREVTEKIDISKEVSQAKEAGYLVYYYSPSDVIKLPKFPKEYLYYQETGSLRDIVTELNRKREAWETEEQIIQNARVIRQDAYIESISYFGEQNLSIPFIKEVVEEYNSSFTISEINNWYKKLSDVLQTALNHEYKKYVKFSR